MKVTILLVKNANKIIILLRKFYLIPVLIWPGILIFSICRQWTLYLIISSSVSDKKPPIWSPVVYILTGWSKVRIKFMKKGVFLYLSHSYG